jgi:hypothetical protein
MSTTEALARLKHGHTVNCMTPDGLRFQIQSKLAYGLTWYRVRPARHGCINKYSRLHEDQLLRWLESVETHG